ncbi:MAG: hypothetical protein RR209_05560 [Angelakisella sp.]
MKRLLIGLLTTAMMFTILSTTAISAQETANEVQASQDSIPIITTGKTTAEDYMGDCGLVAMTKSAHWVDEAAGTAVISFVISVDAPIDNPDIAITDMKLFDRLNA